MPFTLNWFTDLNTLVWFCCMKWLGHLVLFLDGMLVKVSILSGCPVETGGVHHVQTTIIPTKTFQCAIHLSNMPHAEPVLTVIRLNGIKLKGTYKHIQ